MVIVLNGADFSQNNIGTITLPRDISNFTKAAILASGNIALSDEQKTILDDLFIALGATTNTGIWPKIDKLYLPMIAGSLSKAFINYKNNDADCLPNSQYWQMYLKGVKPLGAIDSSAALKLDSSFVLDYRDFSAFMLNAENISTATTKFIGGVMRYAGGTAYTGLRMNMSGPTVPYDVLSIGFPLNNNLMDPFTETPYGHNADLTAGHLRGLSSNGTNANMYYGGENTVTAQFRNDAVDYLDLTPSNLWYGGRYDGQVLLSDFDLISCGALVIGKYLSASEVETLKSTIENLYSSL